jgi:hypothetical protein
MYNFQLFIASSKKQCFDMSEKKSPNPGRVSVSPLKMLYYNRPVAHTSRCSKNEPSARQMMKCGPFSAPSRWIAEQTRCTLTKSGAGYRNVCLHASNAEPISEHSGVGGLFSAGWLSVGVLKIGIEKNAEGSAAEWTEN